MAHGADASEFLDIEMDQFAGMMALVAPDRLGWSKAEILLRPSRRRMRLTVAGDTPTSAAICLAV